MAWRKTTLSSSGIGCSRQFKAAAVAGAIYAVTMASGAFGEGMVGVGATGAEGTYVAVALDGNANSSQGVAVSGTGIANGGAAAVSGTGTADSGAVGSLSVLGPADTRDGVVAVSGKNELENVNVCSIAVCDDALGDVEGQYFAVTALAGVRHPYPVPQVCTGVCTSNHYQRDCPEIRDGTGSWRIIEDGWWDINGCPIVLRYGVHNGQNSGWGWIHIQEKDKDWEWGNYTYDLTGQALGTGTRIMVDNGYMLHCFNYKTPGGHKRTWHVFVDYKGGKGITTVFYRTGHNQCRSS